MSQLFSSGGQSLELQFSTSPFSEYSGLISRIDWFDLFAVQGALKSVLQNRSAKASMLWCSAFLIVQLSQPYMTTGKIIALTIRTFVSKMMSLLFNTLSRFEILEANERVPEVEYLSMCGFPIDLETVLLEPKSDHIIA